MLLTQVNYDIDVPLFLGALYGDRRVHDIALLRAIERQSGGLKFDGQVGEYAYNHSCAQRTAGAWHRAWLSNVHTGS